MKSKRSVRCPSCGEEADITCLGKRYGVYPSGCFLILSLPLSMVHRLSSPIEFRCRNCNRVFGKRTGFGIFGLVLLCLILAFALVQGLLLLFLLILGA
jgi:hypothetical protein